MSSVTIVSIIPVFAAKETPTNLRIIGDPTTTSLTLAWDRNGAAPTGYKITGVPVIINTSMNVMGEPIVNTPEQAYSMITDMDCIVMGNNLVKK